jgi:hypothetical protein
MTDDFEGRLEEHLAATASRMPPDLRRSILEEFPGHGQAGPRPPWLGRIGRLSFAAGVLAAVIVAVVNAPLIFDRTGLGPGGRPSNSPAFVWDAVLGFREFPIQSNPSMDAYGNQSVWSYLHAAGGVHDPTRYVRFTEFDGGARDAWVDAAHDGLAVGFVLGDDALTLQPWGRGPTETEAAIVAWRDPVGGPVAVSGVIEVDAACGDGIDVSIDQGGRPIEEFSLPNGTRAFDLAPEMSRGETLYVRVEPGSSGSADCDTTWLTLTVTR